MLKKILIGLLLAGSAVLAAHAQGGKEINFGIISTESTQNLKEQWQPLLEDMSRVTGIKVKAFFAPDYAGVIEGMRFNKVQVAWFGNKSAMEAVDRASGEVFVQTVAADGAPGYWSLLITHKDSPYHSLEDVLKNGKRINFGIGDPNSTSGFLVPSYYVFALNNVDPKTLFKTVRSANHETNLMAVANRQVDVATNNTENWERFKSKFPEKLKEVRIIWKSPLIPSDPLVWRKDLDPAVKAKVKDFLTRYGKSDAREQAVLRKLLLAGFKESSDSQLLPIRQLELYKTKTRIEADTHMGAEEKKAKLEAIARQLAQLNQQLAAAK